MRSMIGFSLFACSQIPERIICPARQPRAMAGALVPQDTMTGKAEQSTTRKP
jgi:hypothetical protein